MAFNFPEGSKFQFSSTFASVITVSAASNASPCVLTTSAAHGLTTGDEVLFNSGWEDAQNAIYRVTNLTATTLSLQGLDTTSTTFFSAGSGTGTIQKLNTWVDIPQTLSINASGGTAKFTTVQLLASRNALSIPVGFDPSTTTLTLAHDPAAANYITMLGLSRTFTKVGFRIVGAGGTQYQYGYMTVGEIPKKQAGQVDQIDVGIAALGRVLSY